MNILGVDPGMDNLGLCLLRLSPDDDVVDIVDISTVVSKPGVYIVPANYDTGVLKFKYMTDTVINYIRRHDVNVVILEQPFFQQLHTHAVLRLYRLFWTMIDTLQEVLPSVEIRSITAPKARASIRYNRKLGKTVKDAVSLALSKLPICQQLNVDDHSEHALDALTISLAYVAYITGADLTQETLTCQKK
jgi:Holliday junction resolvasome RuvABC endonuclease subunit